jgi:hypothetical protein
MKPEGFRKVYSERGVEGALFVLADAIDALARRVNEQNAVEDKLRGEEAASSGQPQPTPQQPQQNQPQPTPLPPQSQAESQPATPGAEATATPQTEEVPRA